MPLQWEPDRTFLERCAVLKSGREHDEAHVLDRDRRLEVVTALLKSIPNGLLDDVEEREGERYGWKMLHLTPFVVGHLLDGFCYFRNEPDHLIGRVYEWYVYWKPIPEYRAMLLQLDTDALLKHLRNTTKQLPTH